MIKLLPIIITGACLCIAVHSGRISMPKVNVFVDQDDFLSTLGEDAPTPVNRVKAAAAECDDPPSIPRQKRLRKCHFSCIRGAASAPKKELFGENSLGTPVTPETRSSNNRDSPSESLNILEKHIQARPTRNYSTIGRTDHTEETEDAWLLSQTCSQGTNRPKPCYLQLRKILFCDLENSMFLNRVCNKRIMFRCCTDRELRALTGFSDLFYARPGVHSLSVMIEKKTGSKVILRFCKCRFSSKIPCKQRFGT